jgi:RNA polymerase sigma-70 factor (ECF subfamily)
MATTLRRIAVDYEPVRLAGDDGGAELEQQLVDRARSGDQVAFETLYRRYVKRIHAFAYRRSHSRELAEDVTAATFERAYRQIERFEWRGGGFGAWLFRIAANELADFYRRQQRTRSDRGQVAMGALHNTVNFDDVDRIEEGEDPARRMMVALGTLNTRYHEAISLRYLAGLSHEEAAEAMGVSKPVMAVTLTRALKALKKAMEKDGNQEGGGIR